MHSTLDKRHIYKTSPVRYYRCFDELTTVHHLFAVPSLLDIVMVYLWDDPPVFVKLPKHVDISSAVCRSKILDSVDDLPSQEIPVNERLVGRIGTSCFSGCSEFGDPFIIVYVSPYSFVRQRNPVLGVIYPRIDIDVKKPWKENPISFSPWKSKIYWKEKGQDQMTLKRDDEKISSIEQNNNLNGIRVLTKRIDERYQSWNNCQEFDTFGLDVQNPLLSDAYYPVHLIAPDLFSLPVKDPNRNYRNHLNVNVGFLEYLNGDRSYHNYEFVDEALFLYKQDQVIDADRMLRDDEHHSDSIDEGSMCPSNILTAFEYDQIKQSCVSRFL